MKRQIVAFAAAAAMLVGVTGGVSASAVQNTAPYQKSCSEIINSFQANELNLTPVDSADAYFGGSVRLYQEIQRFCKTGLG